jgi:p-hydroxybenzoate 3-monooxygenase
MRTQVAIVGAGPAGLLLSHLLQRAGIDSVIIEDRSREYVEQRVRAGVLEQPTVDLLTEVGLAERLHREALTHHGVNVQYLGTRHRIPLSDLTDGKSITIYGQQELVKDLIAARLAAGGEVIFEVDDVRLVDVTTDHPMVRFRSDGIDNELDCDFVAGCDGFHGVSRDVIPADGRQIFDHTYPYAWLGILAAVPPSLDEVLYANHEHGLGLHSMRSPSVTRLYLQVDPDEQIEAWPDERIWAELHVRLDIDGWTLHEGEVLEKGIAPMRSFVVEPMQYGNLFLAGDAAHIVPATGAKGLNLAVSDVPALARALEQWYRSGDRAALAGYSARCLGRVWRVQEFSVSISTMLHRMPGADPFFRRLQISQLEHLTGSEAAARSFAENYVGLPFA